MTDEQLIELVQRKAPEELSLDEIELLRARLGDSSVLQQTLSEELHLEQYLSRALGRIDVSVDDVLSQVEAARPNVSRWWAAAGFGLGLLVTISLIGGAVVWQRLAASSREATERVVEDADPAKAEAQKSDKPATAEESSKPDTSTEVAAVKKEPGIDPAIGDAEAAPVVVQVAEDNVSPKPVKKPRADKRAEGPWNADDQLKGPRLSPDELAIRLRTHEQYHMAESLLKEWLEPVAGQRLNWKDEWRSCRLDGIARLQAPWPADAALRWTGAGYEGFAIHVWHGTQGVSLRHYGNLSSNMSWAAYRVHRKAKEPVPAEKACALADTDSGRYWRTQRSNNSPLDLRFEHGEIVLARGNLPLVRAALPGPPEEVIFEGKWMVSDIAMVLTEPLEEYQPPQRNLVLDGSDPEQLTWKQSGNAVEATNEAPAKPEYPVWSAFELPPTGPVQIDFVVASAVPGTGLFVADETCARKYGLRFLKAKEPETLMLMHLDINDNRTETDHNLRSRAVPLVQFPAQVRIIVAGRKLKCYLSVDGTSWAQIYDPVTVDPNAPIRLAGHYAMENSDPAGLKLASVAMRTYPALDRLTEQDLVARAPLHSAENYGQWLEQSLGAQPDDVETEAWLRACALRTLGAGAGGRGARQLVVGLLAGGLAELETVEEKLTLMSELVEASDNWVNGEEGFGWPVLQPFLDQLSRNVAMSADPRPFTRVMQPAVAFPFWTGDSQQPFPYEAAHDEIAALTAQSNWTPVAALTRTLQTRSDESLKHVLAWAETLAAPHVSGLTNRELQSETRHRHPLEIDLSREGFNRLAEIDAALASGAEQEACELITSLPTWESFGWLLSGEPDRWTSLPQAIRERYKKYPALAERIKSEYVPRGELRLKQAVIEQDVATIARIPLQFHGSPPASEARFWLGKRYLASGDLFAALEQFRALREQAPADHLAEAAPYELLTRSMVGDLALNDAAVQAAPHVDLPTLPESAVRLGEEDLPPAEFKTLLAGFAKSALEPLGGTQLTPDAPTDEFPRPAKFDVQRRARLDQTLGSNPGSRPGAYQSHDVDWVARQLAIVRSGPWLLAHNRFGITGYELASGQRKWHQNLGDNKAETHAWPLTPFQPIVAGHRVFARRLLQQGPGVACLEIGDGKVVWQAEAGENRLYTSDPVVVGRQLLALCAENTPRKTIVELVALDRDTGAPLWQKRLLEFDKTFAENPACTLIRYEDSLIATLPGSVLCCGLDGSRHWVRRQPWFPPNVSLHWCDLSAQPPLVENGKLFVIQPGATSIECLRPESGEVVWSRFFPRIRELVGFAQEQLIVHEGDSLLALDPQDGTDGWRHELDAPLALKLLGDKEMIYARKERDLTSNRKFPQLVWLDLATGQPRASVLVDLLAHDDPFLGPALVDGKRFWVFSGVGAGDPARDLTELIAQEPNEQLSSRFDWASHWYRDVPVPVRDATANILDDWTLLSAVNQGKAATLGPQPGTSKPSVALEATDAVPIRLARRIRLPAGTKPKLILGAIRHGHAPQRLEVLVDGQSVWQSDPAQNIDKPHRVDLKEFAGEDVWIVVRQWPSPGGNPEIYWDRLDIAL